METTDPGKSEEQGSHDGDTTPDFVGIGSRLDWDSPLLDVALSVELPFWLLMPATSLRVTVADFTTNVVIDNDGIEIQHGRQFSRTHQNTVFLGGKEAAKRATAPVTALPEGGLFRATRTLLYIETYAIEDALNAFWGNDGPRYQDASRYFASLALGHLPVVNKVINAYRMACRDAEFEFETGKIAAEFGICVVRTPDLARLVLGAMEYNWSLATIIRDVLQGGIFRASPPASQYLGDVYHFWSEPKVVGVQATTSFELSDDDIIAIQLPQKFHQCELVEPRVDSEGRLTFKVDLERSDVPVGSRVFLLDRQLSFQPKTIEEAEESDEFRMIAGSAVHPSSEP